VRTEEFDKWGLAGRRTTGAWRVETEMAPEGKPGAEPEVLAVVEGAAGLAEEPPPLLGEQPDHGRAAASTVAVRKVLRREITF
jgi:hypothetical protein